MQNLELCVPADKFERVKEICAPEADFIALPDIKIPDFYHPYKRGAHHFQFAGTKGEIHLHVVADTTLRLNLAPYSTSSTVVSSTLADLYDGTEDDVLGKLKFPTLPNFVNAWLNLACEEHVVGTAEEFIFLMNAERLIDANRVVNLAWCQEHIHLEASLSLAMGLLRSQQLRINQSTWN
jgi:hypothetical protein